jgi:hypothetical protein
MIFSENRYPPRIKCGAGFFGIMRDEGRVTGPSTVEGAVSLFSTTRRIARGEL